MSRMDERGLIVSLTPAPGFYAVMVKPETEEPVEFWPLVGWALVERDYREDPDGPPNIDRQVEGMIAVADVVVSCHDRNLDAETPYLFVGYDHERDSPIWEEEAARRRSQYRHKQAAEAKDREPTATPTAPRPKERR